MMLFLENYPTQKKKFEECLKLNSWNGFFVSTSLNLGFNWGISKWTTIKTCRWDKLLFTLTRDTLHKAGLFEATSTLLELWKYANFSPFLNHWINFCIVVQVFRARLSLICVRQIQVWPYLRSKTSMSNASFHSVNSRSDGRRYVFCFAFFFVNLNAALPFSLQNLVAKTPVPDSFECFLDPQQSFGNPLRTYFSAILCEPCSWKIEIFSAAVKFSYLISRDL